MKAAELKVITQVIELDGEEVQECFRSYLKSKGLSILPQTKLSFDVKIGATSRDIEAIKITAKLIENGTCNGTEAAAPL